MGVIEDIKKAQKASAEAIKAKIQELFFEMNELESGRTIIHVNGESEDLRKHCIVAKESIKIKNVV